MEGLNSNNPGGGKNIPPLQRGVSLKRAVLIPQVTNLKFDYNTNNPDLEALANGGVHNSNADLKHRRSSYRLKSLNHLKSVNHLSSANLPISHQTSNNQLKTEENLLIERFLENVPKVGLAKEDSKLIRTRVIEEMYRIQERTNITAEERQKLFQIAVSMDAPKLARKLVADAKDMILSNQNRQGVGAFLTGELMNFDDSPARHSSSEEQSPFVNGTAVGGGSSPYSNRNQLEDLEINEDELFCKAFDEVERIRKRILQRASNHPNSPTRTENKGSFLNERNDFDNITLQKKTDHDRSSGSDAFSQLPKSTAKSSKSLTGGGGSHHKIYPAETVPLPPKTTHKSPRLSDPLNNEIANPIARSRSQSSNALTHSFDETDLQVTHAIDSLIGSAETSRRNSKVEPPEMIIASFDDEKNHKVPPSLPSDEGFSLHDPFYKADQNHFQKNKKMNSSLLRSAEQELKMVKDKFSHFEDVTTSQETMKVPAIAPTVSIDFDSKDRHPVLLSSESSNMSKYFAHGNSGLKGEEGRKEPKKSPSKGNNEHHFFAEPKNSNAQSSTKNKNSPSVPPLLPALRPSSQGNKPISQRPTPVEIDSNQQTHQGSNKNSALMSSRLQARMLVASPLSDWLQIGLNLDLPSSAKSIESNDPSSTTTAASTMNHGNEARFSRQSSGFLLEPIHHSSSGAGGGGIGGNHDDFKSSSLRSNLPHHHHQAHTTSHLQGGNTKFFENSMTDKERGVMNSYELLRHFPDGDALQKVKKSLLVLNDQIQQLHSPKSSKVFALSPSSSSPHTPKSPLHNIPLKPKISNAPSHSAPSSTRNSELSTGVLTNEHRKKASMEDDLSSLLESHDSFEEATHDPVSSNVIHPIPKKVVSRKDFVSASVDELGKSDSSSPQQAKSLVSQSLTDEQHLEERTTSRHAVYPSMRSALDNRQTINSPRLFEYTKNDDGFKGRNQKINGNNVVPTPSPRVLGNTGNVLKAGGLSLMRENSHRNLVVEDVASTKSKRTDSPANFFGGSEKITSNQSDKARVAALAAALDAGDAVGKLMAEMFSTSKKH